MHVFSFYFRLSVENFALHVEDAYSRVGMNIPVLGIALWGEDANIIRVQINCAAPKGAGYVVRPSPHSEEWG